jgi:hypothetical protein
LAILQGVRKVDLWRLRAALEASWSAETAYRRVVQPGNPAYGQCYPTARVVQHLLPEAEVVEGDVLTDAGVEAHFWNVVRANETVEHIDLTWSQFPAGSSVRTYAVRDRSTYGDGPETVRRVETLLRRVRTRLGAEAPAVVAATAPAGTLAGPRRRVI